MRASSLFLLFGLAPLVLPAQSFEGKVTVRVAAGTAGAPRSFDMTMFIKGEQSAMTMTMPADGNAGAMAGQQIRMIMDGVAGTTTTLMPLPPQMAQAIPGASGAKGLKITMSRADLAKVQSSEDHSDSKVTVRKLGTSEKIAGYSCDDYEVTGEKGESWRMCASSNLGNFVFPTVRNPMGGRGSSAPGWARAFGNRPMFPLKVWSPNDSASVAFEVTAIERVAVPASTFVIPEGYMDMSALMRGRGGH